MSDEGKTPPEGDPRKMLEEEILADHPRLGPEDKFKFRCHPGVPCFNTCCADVNIFLSPYDVLRLTDRLGISSTEFLETYTLLPVQKDMNTPVVLLKMQDNEEKSCHFLTDEGCGVYSDRPWPCRMYPVGLATSRDTEDGWRGERFYFLLKEDACQGHNEGKKDGLEWTVQEWMDDQNVDAYDEWGEAFKELSLHRFFDDYGPLPPSKMEMFFNATYDLQKFREFVFGSSLLDRFEVDEDFIHQMQTSNEALLRFGFLWIRFAVFGESTMKVRAEAEQAVKDKLDKKQDSEDSGTPTSPQKEAP
ncbi:MAG: YkgJ family cysteine cluster protein [Gemmatimonadetes bacterium]|nr:YkgJ family cysteine cluster protein [Gemmatimonadota bacterium]